MTATRIYKLLTAGQWRAAKAAGVFRGAPDDWRDGFIHFSDASQLRETARKHFAGAGPLKIIAVETDALGDALKWEPSRGGALFPHLYGDLKLDMVADVFDAPPGDDGAHILPSDLV
ncbi:MAG: DUF952 domain-containing protein [Pseudomonadota bacterium]